MASQSGMALSRCTGPINWTGWGVLHCFRLRDVQDKQNDIPVKREQSNVSHFLAAISDILDFSDTSLPEIHHILQNTDIHSPNLTGLTQANRSVDVTSNYCKKLNTLKHLVRSTVATSHNCNSKYQKGDIIAHQHIWHVVNVLISNMGRGKFDTPPSKNPLTDGQMNLYRWLYWGYLPPCRILYKSFLGFRFCACVIAHPSEPKLTPLLFLGVLPLAPSQYACTDFDT